MARGLDNMLSNGQRLMIISHLIGDMGTMYRQPIYISAEAVSEEEQARKIKRAKDKRVRKLAKRLAIEGDV